MKAASDTQQTDLFARARTADPASSHAAAERVEASGEAKIQREVAAALVARHPGATTRELSACHPPGENRESFYHTLARRLPELERAKRVYAVSTGRDSLRWRPGRKPGSICPHHRCGERRPCGVHAVEASREERFQG